MSEVTVIQPTYDEFVAQFSWDQVLAHFDWPVTEKFNLGHELCDRWAKHPTRADALAMRYETKDGSQGGYTYRQLRDLSNRFAAALTRLGIQRGDRVAGLMPKIPAFLPMLLGIWKTGAVYVPIFTAFAAPAVAYRLRDSEARLVITTETYLPVIRESQQLANGLTALEQVLVVADPGQMFEGHTLNFWALLEAATPDFQAVEMQLDDVAVLQYTSGSTGNPKGAMIANTFALALYPYARYALNIREDDVFWGAADPGWAYGGIICLPSPLLDRVLECAAVMLHGQKSKIEEVFCGFACYTSEEVLLDARSQPENQSPPDAARGKHQRDEAEGAGRKAVIKGRVKPCA